MTPQGGPPALVQAKLTTPHAVDAVVSPALLRLFETCVQRRLTVISAPAGYGKTTVTVAALRALRISHVWYRVDVLDHDPAVTVLSLCEALHRRRPGFGELLRERLQHPSESPLSAEGMAAAFVVEAQGAPAADLHLVIDDYHEATGSCEFNRTLDYLIANLPASWRLIVLGRYDPGFETSRLRLEGQLGFIGAENLRLDAAQVGEILVRHAPEADQDLATRLTELTEGWPAAVSLAAEAVAGRSQGSVDEILADPRLTGDLYAYVAEQVYRREPPDVRRFLRRTCDLDALSPDIADRVAGTGDAHRHLERLAKHRIFTVKVPETGSYRYHPLFRDYLREACLLEDGPDACRERRLHTAGVLEASGEIERAVELLIAAGEPDLALAAIARQGESAFGRHRAETLDAWLERLPATLVQSHPWAQLLSAHRETRDGRYAQALQRIEAAKSVFRTADDRHGFYSALSAQERALFWKGDPRAALETCREALTVATSDAEKLHTYASILSAAVDMGDWPTAEAAQRESASLAVAGPPEELARIRALHCHSLYKRGRFRDARREAFRVSAQSGSPFSRPELLTSRATIAYAMADYGDAVEESSTALEAALNVGHEVLVGFAHDTTGFTEQLRSGGSAGVDEIQTAREILLRLGDTSAAVWPTTHIGTFHRRSGRLSQALTSYQDACSMITLDRDNLGSYNARTNLQFVLGLDGQSGAVRRLCELEEKGSELSLAFVQYKAAFFRNCLAVRAGHEEPALSDLAATIAAQVDLGHLSFVGRELLTQWDIGEAVLRELADQTLVRIVIDAIARHAGSQDALAAAARIGETHALAALEASRRWHDAGAQVALARCALTLGHRRTRLAAAELLLPPTAPPDDRVRLTYDLTTRETQVLALMAKGLGNPEIETALHVSHGTMKTHVNHIYRKLGVTDRVAAVLLYKESAVAAD